MEQVSGLNSPEKSTEKAIENTIAKVEKALQPVYGERRAGKRRLFCGIFSYSVEYLARQAGLPADVYQVRDIHTRLLHEHLYKDPFKHVFTVIRAGDQGYIVDLTVGQFLKKDRKPRENPLINTLLQKGYIPLIEETLKDYLEFTNPNPSKDFKERLDRFTKLENFLNPAIVPPRPSDYSEEDMQRILQ